MNKLGQRLWVMGISAALLSQTIWANDYANHWAKTAIEKWSNYGIVKGYEDQSFRPNNAITRAEFAAILSRTFNLTNTEGAHTYVDLITDESKWYIQPIKQVMALDLMYIEGNYFRPDQNITREEAAYAITKAYELKGNGQAINFSDNEQISSWSKDSINALVQAQYLKGNPDGSFRPQGTLTRAELVTMLENITKQLISTPGTYSQSIQGNVVVNSKDVKLKDMTINGDLYLTQGIGKGNVTLENVTVTGKIIVNGGALNMSGQYGTLQVGTDTNIVLTAGTIQSVIVNEIGSSLKVGATASISNLVENKPIVLMGEGSIANQLISQMTPIKVQSAGVYINNQYVALPIVDNKVIIDVPALSKTYKATDVLNGLRFETNIAGAKIYSKWGSLNAGEQYTFNQAEEELGMLREVALEAGINPSLVVGYILGTPQLTIGGLLQDYQTAQQLSSSLDVQIKDSYEFTRTASYTGGRAGQFIIKMKLK